MFLIIIVKMYMTESLSHIMIGYSGFFHLCICVSLSATCTESYKQIFYSLTAAYCGQSINVSGGDIGGSDDGGGLSNLYCDTVTP